MISRGQAIELTCPLGHNSPFLLSWFKNGNKLSSALTNNRFQMNSTNLKINHFLKLDIGVYNCELITGNGQVIQSGHANLLSNVESNVHKNTEQVTKKIQGHKPQFINSYSLIENQYEESSLQLDCLALGNPKPNILWYKNGRVVSEEEYGIVRNLMLFKFNKLYASDSAQYRCQVFNQFGEINRHFNLNVIRTEKLSVKHETNVNLNCSDDKSKWYVKYKNREYLSENKINIGSDDFYLLESNLISYGELVIKKANLFSSGLYVCVNGNKVTSNVFDLEVHGFSPINPVSLEIGYQNQKLAITDNYPLPVLIIIVLSILSLVLIVILTLYYLVKLRKGVDYNDVSVKHSFDRPNSSNHETNYFEMRRFSVVPGLSTMPTYVYPQQLFRSQMIRPTQSTPQYFQCVQRPDLIISNSNVLLNNASYQSNRNNLSSINHSNSYRSCSKF